MAKGLSACLDRFEAVITGANSEWSRTKQRVTEMSDLNSDNNAAGSKIALLSRSGSDRKFFVHGRGRLDQGPLTAANIVDRDYEVSVEFSRYLGGGDVNSHDTYGLQKSLEEEVDKIEQYLLYTLNWDYANTGVILVNLEESLLSEKSQMGSMIWESKFKVKIRQSNLAATV